MLKRLCEKQSGHMPDQIFKTPNVGLLALGSAACIRTIYLSAWNMQCLNRFAYVQMEPRDYALGNTEKFKSSLQKMVDSCQIGGIIVYTSCMEIITSMNLELLVSEIQNPKEIPIKIFYRGPMVSRRRNPSENLKNILSSLKDLPKQHPSGSLSLPMPLMAPDFAAVLSLLKTFPFEKLLITPGGCGNCANLEKCQNQQEDIYMTEFDDLQLAMGCEDQLFSEVRHKLPLCRPLCGLQTGVPYLTGQKWEEFFTKQSKETVEKIWLGCSGFEFGVTGAARALELLGNRWIARHRLHRGGKTILLLGNYEAGTPQSEYYQKIKHLLKRNGYDFAEFGQIWNSPQTIDAAYLWVLSAEALPLARQWKAKWNIPLLDDLSSECPLTPKQDLSTKSFIVFTEPLLGIRLKKFLSKGSAKVSVFTYVPDQKTASFYQTHLKEKLNYIFRCEDLMKLNQQDSDWICDPVFLPYLKNVSKDRFHPLVYPMISGGLF